MCGSLARAATCMMERDSGGCYNTCGNGDSCSSGSDSKKSNNGG